MKNRYIPFGYQIQNGDSVINTEQAATVQHIYRAIHSYTNARTGKSKTLADAGITFWESELLHDGYRITDQTGTRASRPYTTKIG